MKRTINYLAICLAAITVLLPTSMSADEIIIKNDSTLAIVMPLSISKDSTGVFYLQESVLADTLRINKISRVNGTENEQLTVKGDNDTIDLGGNIGYGKPKNGPILVGDSCRITWGDKSYLLMMERALQPPVDTLKTDSDSLNLAGEYLLLLVKSSNSTENINKEDVVCGISMPWVIFSGILLLAIIIAVLIISCMIVKKKESVIRTQVQLLKAITVYPKSKNDNSYDNILKQLKENISEMESKIDTLGEFKSKITHYLSSDCEVEIKYGTTTESIIEQLKRHISAQKDNNRTVTLDEIKSRIKDMCNDNLNISDKNNLDEIFKELKSCLDIHKQQSIATQIDKETQKILGSLEISWKNVTSAELIKKLAAEYNEVKELINNEDPNKVFKEKLEKIKTSTSLPEISRILKDKNPANVEELCKLFSEYLQGYFSKAVEHPNESQRHKLVNYLKDFLKEMSGKNFGSISTDEIKVQYNLLSDKELNEKCLEIIKEKTGKTYDTYEALKSDIEKPSADAPVKTLEDVQKLDEYDKLLQYGENAEKIIKELKGIGLKDLLGCDYATATKNLNVFKTLSKQTKKDTADDIRLAIINEAVEGIKIIIDDKAKDLVQITDMKNQISSINSCNEPDAMSTALKNLVNIFARELRTLQEGVNEARGKENQLLNNIKSNYKSLFNNEELTALNPTPAFNSFVTKVKSVTAALNGQIQEADRKNSDLLGKIKSDYKTLFDDEELKAVKLEDAINSFVEKSNDLKDNKNKLTAKLENEQAVVRRLTDESESKTEEIKTMCREWISQISITFDEINTAINSTCRIPSNDISDRFRRFVIDNDGYNVEAFRTDLMAILDSKNMLFADYQRIKLDIKELIRKALGQNSWIHALTRMYLYIQQPKISEYFFKAGVVTLSIERAFIITEQMLRAYGVLLEYPNLFIDEFDNDKYDNRPLADINNVIGHSLVRELVNDRTSVLIDLHRVGYTIDDTTSKPLVSKFS